MLAHIAQTVVQVAAHAVHMLSIIVPAGAPIPPFD